MRRTPTPSSVRHQLEKRGRELRDEWEQVEAALKAINENEALTDAILAALVASGIKFHLPAEANKAICPRCEQLVRTTLDCGLYSHQPCGSVRPNHDGSWERYDEEANSWVTERWGPNEEIERVAEPDVER